MGKKALVTGATGFVGSRLCRELCENGYAVRALHRPTSDLSSLAGLPIEYCVGDVTDRGSLKEALSGVEVVFHVAALFREAKHPDEVYWQVNVEGTRNVFEESIAAGVKRIIHCSTIGVHSHIPNPPAAEDEAYRPADIYQRTKCEGEKLALSYFKDKRIEGAVIRPAMIWGPSDKRTLKLFKGIKEKKLPMIGTGETLTHWVLVDDLVKGFRLAGEQEGQYGEIYIIAGDRPVKLEYVYRTIASKLGVELWPFRIPALPIQVLGSIVEAICVPFGIEPPIYRRRVDFFTKTRAFNCEKARSRLGYQPARTFEEEVDYIAGWYTENGWI